MKLILIGLVIAVIVLMVWFRTRRERVIRENRRGVPPDEGR